MMNGLLVIDKPGGMTSRAVVNTVQKWFPRKTKIGHTGTLDPLATGVLVVCVGAATRLADYVQAMGKSYASRFRLGATSTTDDADGEVTERLGVVPPTREAIDEAFARFVGVIEQVPPAVSALKVDGQRAHDLVRRGKDVKLAARPVRIDAIRVIGYEWPWLDVEVDCGKGTYIRSIARDLGAALGCGGMVQTLQRTRVGCYHAEDAVTLDLDPQAVSDHICPMSSALSALPVARIPTDSIVRFRHGQTVAVLAGASVGEGIEVAVVGGFEEVIGVAIVQGNGLVKPALVLAQ
jgi:tRNA pseudouridine55 synthase